MKILLVNRREVRAFGGLGKPIDLPSHIPYDPGQGTIQPGLLTKYRPKTPVQSIVLLQHYPSERKHK